MSNRSLDFNLDPKRLNLVGDRYILGRKVVPISVGHTIVRGVFSTGAMGALAPAILRIGI